MKQKRIKFRQAALILAGMAVVTAEAYDFESGGLCYNILSASDATVEVTSPNSYVYGGYRGSIEIPTQVTNGDTTYSVTRVGSSAFRNCSDLYCVRVPSSVTAIGSNAFVNCSSLAAVRIGENVESIGYDAFYGCTAMTVLVSEALTPPACDSQALYFVNKLACTLYVPSNSQTAYATAPQWCDFQLNEIMQYERMLYLTAGGESVSVSLEDGFTVIWIDATLGELCLENYSSDEWYEWQWSLTEFESWCFGRDYPLTDTERQHSGVSSPTADAVDIAVRFNGSQVTVAAPAGTPVVIADSSGRVVTQTRTGASELTVSLTQPGVYLVRAGIKSLKIVKR